MFPAAHATCKPSNVVERVTIRVATAGLLVFAAGGCLRLPHFEYVVAVETRYPGASTDQVDSAITRPIEDALRSIDDFEEIISETRPGHSRVEVRIAGGTHPALVRGQIQQRLWDVAPLLPRGARPVIYKRQDERVFFVESLQRAPEDPTPAEIAARMAQRVRLLPLVASAEVLGPRPARRVRIDSAKIAEREVATSDVLFALRTRGAFTFPERDLGLVPVTPGSLLSDFVRVEDGLEPGSVAFRAPAGPSGSIGREQGRRESTFARSSTWSNPRPTQALRSETRQKGCLCPRSSMLVRSGSRKSLSAPGMERSSPSASSSRGPSRREWIGDATGKSSSRRSGCGTAAGNERCAASSTAWAAFARRLRSGEGMRGFVSEALAK